MELRILGGALGEDTGLSSVALVDQKGHVSNSKSKLMVVWETRYGK